MVKIVFFHDLELKSQPSYLFKISELIKIFTLQKLKGISYLQVVGNFISASSREFLSLREYHTCNFFGGMAFMGFLCDHRLGNHDIEESPSSEMK